VLAPLSLWEWMTEEVIMLALKPEKPTLASFFLLPNCT
jgi:hypothetical protein